MDSTPAPAPSFWWYGAVLLRWRRFVVGVPLLAALIAGGSSLLSTRRYQASAIIMPSDATGGGSALGQIASQFGLSLPRSGGLPSQFYADLVTSRSVLHDVLYGKYQASGAFGGDLLAFLHLDREPHDLQVELGLERLKGMISASLNRQTNAIRIDVSTPVPGLSQQIAEHLLVLLNESNLRRRQAQAQAEEAFIESQLANARRSLREAEDALAHFNERNRVVGGSPDLQQQRGRLEREAQLQQQLYLALAQGYQQARVESVRDTPIITVVDAPDILVEPMGRGTIRKTVLALILGAVLAMTCAFVIEHFRRIEPRDPSERDDFVRLASAALGPLSRLRPRSHPAGS